MIRHQPRPESRAALAARRGVTRGAVTLACRPGGALAAAALPGGRVDTAHPAAIAWLGRNNAFTAADWAGLPTTAITLEEFARTAGVSPEQLEMDLQSSPELAEAIIEGPIDADHPAAMAFLARRKRSRP